MTTLCGVVAFLTAGCGNMTATEGLDIMASFASGMPRSARDQAVRVEVFLVDSCDTVVTAGRPDGAIGSTFRLRDGSDGPPIAIPNPGEYGLYAVAQDSNCAVVAVGCTAVAISADHQDTLSVTMGAFSGQGCSTDEQCSIESGECTGSDGGVGGAGGGGTGGVGGIGGVGGVGGAGVDDCVDMDGDGLGNGALGNAGCIDPTTDSNDDDGTRCADTDGDGCDDCAITSFDPSNDGLDDDGDGVCALSDCDDDKPRCASVCTDLDEDGYCADTDCDDTVRSCALDCTTNSDGDAHVDCFETFCGTNPTNSASECLEVSSEAGYQSAIDAANANVGRDYVVLHDFTMTTSPPSLDDDAGVTIGQVAGATLAVASGGNVLVFKLKSANNLIEGIRVVNLLNAEDIIVIEGDNNTIQNCALEGFERRGIYVNGGNDAQLLHNIIIGGTNAQGDETGAIILKDTGGSVVAGNTVALNEMDGVQVRKAVAPVIDQNTIADNGGSGIDFYGDASSGVCMRNNNVTGNADFGLNASKTITFDLSPACTGPLSSGPAYGNNAFDNVAGACGGAECASCACIPGASFWSYADDPGYRSVTAGDGDFYCLGASSTLVDGGDDLLSHDLNGIAPGDFNGSNPDIGAREDGPTDCN